MHAILIVNPAAGHGAARRLAPRISAYLSQFGVRIDTQHFSAAAGGIAELVRTHATSNTDALIIAGGDGSVHEAVNGWCQAGGGVPLAFVPVGTGNDFTKMLGYGSDWRAACVRIAKRKTRRVDVGRCNDFYFANNLGIGFDARVAMAASRMRHLPGQAVYVAATIHTLIAPVQSPVVTIEHAGNTFETAITLVAVHNGRVEGGSFQLAPQAEIDDGLLDVIVAGKLSRLGIMRLVPTVLRGRHLNHPAVTVFRTGRLRIESASELPVHADGEIRYTGARQLDIGIRPQTLKLIA